MCGIAGVLQREGQPPDPRALRLMAAALAHRGPDGEGFHSEAGAPGIGLASRRLAVIDIPGGGQPMSTEDGAFTLVYNGEIFNAGELRAELEAAGHRFRSRCDTEVVLRGYVEWGERLLERLIGMWAFAVWDRAARRLFLARDRLGVKPLVYADAPGRLVFASELNALLASCLVEGALDLGALPHYLSAFAVPEPLTLLRGVRRLPAGHCLVADASGARERRYWDCSFEEEEDRGRAHYAAELDALLRDSVRRRLASDVPLGVFLSAGVDSGLVAALAARESGEPLRTFTLGFEGSSQDERGEARRLAAALGARHTEDVVTAREAAEALPELLAHHGEPGQSLLQGHFVSRLARQQVTVALSGLGGDELYGSYPTHRVVDLLARLDDLPGPLREAALALARVLPGGRGRRLAELARMRPDERATRRLLHQTDAALRARLIAPDVRAGLDLEAPARHLEAHYRNARARHPLNRLLYVYLKTYLPDELLRTLDTMSMRHSLEARVPLLDHRLVERAMRVPARHKLSLLQQKILLRRVARERLPAGFPRRGKRGFALPLHAWLRGELLEAVRDVLSDAAVRRRGIFEPEAVRRLIDGYCAGDRRLSQPLLMLYAFEQWARRALDARAEPAGPRTQAAQLESAGAGTRAGADAAGADAPELSVIVVSWNTRDLLRDCLRSVATQLAGLEHEVLVVDNASADGSPEMVAAEFPRARLLRSPRNLGFARANNLAMRQARGAWFLLLNSDTLLRDDSAVRLLGAARRVPQLGVAHCRLVYPDGRLQHTTYRFPSLGLALVEDFGLYKLLPRRRRGELLLGGYWEQDAERDVDWVAGALMLLPREVFDLTGGFCEDYFMYGEDMEWCRRIRARGLRVRYFPQASVVHLDHGSAEARWGETRVAICVKRQLDIYRGWHGRAAGAAFRALRTAGALYRAAYFALRGALGGRNAAYYREMRRYQLYAFRAYAGRIEGAA